MWIIIKTILFVLVKQSNLNFMKLWLNCISITQFQFKPYVFCLPSPDLRSVGVASTFCQIQQNTIVIRNHCLSELHNLLFWIQNIVIRWNLDEYHNNNLCIPWQIKLKHSFRRYDKHRTGIHTLPARRTQVSNVIYHRRQCIANYIFGTIWLSSMKRILRKIFPDWSSVEK